MTKAEENFDLSSITTVFGNVATLLSELMAFAVETLQGIANGLFGFLGFDFNFLGE